MNELTSASASIGDTRDDPRPQANQCLPQAIMRNDANPVPRRSDRDGIRVRTPSLDRPPMNRPLFDDDFSYAAPSIPGIDPIDNNGCLMLKIEGKGALGPHDQGRRLGSVLRWRTRRPPRPLDPQRLTMSSELFANDFRPCRNNVGRSKALRRESRSKALVEEFRQRADKGRFHGIKLSIRSILQLRLLSV